MFNDLPEKKLEEKLGSPNFAFSVERLPAGDAKYLFICDYYPITF